ncbi:MAG: ABC transporter ATP-binding protein [Peptococcaceae bacterium]|nr:ABC transporter ATP-binding protein [Peptococcaceae bacterium]
MSEPILSVKNLAKRFGGLVVYKDIGFDLMRGEIVGLMGPNGAGKTTLLNLISGEYKPDSGKIFFDGRDITGLPPHKICRLGIARTYQIPQPFVNLTVLQNVILAAMFGGGLNKADAEKEAERILDLVGLSGKRDVLTQDLTVVTLKMLELARALATNPTIVLLDEIAAGSTEAEIPQILSTIKNLRERGIAFLIIEHVISVLVATVDRILVINEGAIIAEGAPDEVMRNKKVIEVYLG